MLDSTARAERIDLPLSEAAFYAWEVAQKPVAVRLPHALIDRLESEAVETFRSLSSRGSEIGGLLLGSVAPGSPAVVTVTDFELIPCDYGRGPLYRLSDADLARFERAMEKHGSGPRVMGYFRSHTRKGLSLDAEDLAFFEPRFLEPQQVVLLVRPFATKVSSAGIFIRENGRLGGEASYKEFAFRSSELAGAHAAPQKSESSVPLATPASITAAQPASPAKPQSRAQIVPIASRREIALPEAAVSAAPPPPVTAQHIATEHIAEHVAEHVEASPSAAPKAASAPAVVHAPDKAHAPDKEDKGKDKAAALSVEPAVQAAPQASAAAEIASPAAAAKNKKLRLLVAAALGMLVLAGGLLVIYPMLVKRTAPRATAQDSSPLSLREERTAGGMLLTWNRDLAVIQNASKVVLSITDGDRHENIQLDPNQVRTGSILYPPITQDVSFQMEVTGPNQTKTTSESLRVLDPRPSPLEQPSTQPAGANQSAAAKPATTEPVPAPNAETKPADETAAAHPAVPLKAFNTASLAQRLRPVTQDDLPEAPAIGGASSSTAASLPGIVGSQPSMPPPPKPSAAQPTSGANSASALPAGGQLTPAKVISRVDPEYPKLARQAGASGIVELEATISIDGKVKNPRVVRGNTMLQKAAIDAVLQWRYKPAMLNGKAVDSPVEIKLNFVTQH